MGPIINNWEALHKHCGLHQLCVVPSQVRCSRWLIKENLVFWLEAVALGSRVWAQTTGYFSWSRVGPQNRVFCRSRLREPALGIGYFTRATSLRIRYLKVSVPEPTLAGTWFFKRVEPQFRFSIWNRLEPGTRQNRPSLMGSVLGVCPGGLSWGSVMGVCHGIWQYFTDWHAHVYL